MIFTAILSVLYLALLFATLPLRILDDATLPASVSEAINTASSYISMFTESGILTMTTIVTVLSILSLTILYEGYHLVFKIVNWAIRKIPFIG